MQKYSDALDDNFDRKMNSGSCQRGRPDLPWVRISVSRLTN